MKQFNNYQLYTVLHPEDSSPAFAAVTKTAIRVLKPEGKCGRATMEDLENGVINDRTESTDVVIDIDLETLLLEGVEAGLPCLKWIQNICKTTSNSKKVKVSTKTPKYTKKQFYRDLEQECKDKPMWRRGQSAFNLMARIRSVQVDNLRGTSVDPYYDDSRIEAFYEACLGTKKGKK